MKDNELNKYIKLLDFILELANKEEEQYAMKVYHTSELSRITTDIIDRELVNENSLIWVIGSIDAISKIDNWGEFDEKGRPPLGVDPYHPYAFQYEFTKLIKENYSLVIMTNHSNEYQILPKEWQTQKDVSKKRIETHQMISDIYSYTFDDELGKVIIKLTDFIEENNINLREISKTKLFEKLNELKDNNKVLNKKI